MKKILSVITACIISSAGFAGCVEKNKETAEKEKYTLLLNLKNIFQYVYFHF